LGIGVKECWLIGLPIMALLMLGMGFIGFPPIRITQDRGRSGFYTLTPCFKQRPRGSRRGVFSCAHKKCRRKRAGIRSFRWNANESSGGVLLDVVVDGLGGVLTEVLATYQKGQLNR